MLSHPQPQPFCSYPFLQPAWIHDLPWVWYISLPISLVLILATNPYACQVYNGPSLKAGARMFTCSTPFMASLLFTLCDHLRFGLSMLIQSSGVALTAGTTWDRNWDPAGKQPARQPHHQRFGSHCRFYNFVLWMVLATTPNYLYLDISLQPVQASWWFLELVYLLNQRPLAEVWSQPLFFLWYY